MSSEWPDLDPDRDHQVGRQLAAPAAAATLGGAIGWTLFFLGLDLWGLAVGAVAVIVVAAAGARIDARRPSESLAFSIACTLLTWPLIWFLAVFIRYWITGKNYGS